MNSTLTVPLILGIFSVLQGALNRKLAVYWGLPWAAFVNNFVLFVASGVILLLTLRPRLESNPPASFSGSPLLWCVLPGLLGVTLVMGIRGSGPSLARFFVSQVHFAFRSPKKFDSRVCNL